MDDKTMIAAYVAGELQRINKALKDMNTRAVPPTEEEKKALSRDMEITMSRLQNALMQINADMLEKEDDGVPS